MNKFTIHYCNETKDVNVILLDNYLINGTAYTMSWVGGSIVIPYKGCVSSLSGDFASYSINTTDKTITIVENQNTDNSPLVHNLTVYWCNGEHTDFVINQAASNINRYLEFKSLGNNTFSFSKSYTGNVQYSLDSGITWSTYTNGVTVPSGSTILWKGNLDYRQQENISIGIGTFSSTDRFEAYGNPTSLISGDSFSDIATFINIASLFYGCTGLTSAENLVIPSNDRNLRCVAMFQGCTSLTTPPTVLPSTSLTSYCYNAMFANCTSLQTAPELPATTLDIYCYWGMFANCTSLATAPSLPATTLTSNCYRSMFQGCTSLTTPPVLSATTLASACYYGMFSDCTSLATAPSLPSTNLSGCNGCYYSMFSGCTSLTAATELIATTAATDAYKYMFANCYSLVTAPQISATTLGISPYGGSGVCAYMFANCSGLTTAPTVLPASTLEYDSYYCMFSGCTSLVTVPSLPATTLASGCYEKMFQGCTSLVTAQSILPATSLPNDCYKDMFYGCTSLTTAPEIPSMTLDASDCLMRMFYGCSSLNSITCLVYFPSSYSDSYTINWVYGVASSGTFKKRRTMYGWERGANGIPNGWTVVDIG